MRNSKPSGCISRTFTCGLIVFLGVCLASIIVALLEGMGMIDDPVRGTETEAWFMTRKFVTDQLRSPSTADFPWNPTEAKKLGPGKWRIAGHVDSQNAFGATLRTHFVVVVQWHEGNKWSLIDLQFEPQ